MKKKLIFGILLISLAFPFSAFAAEESFVCTIDDPKAIIAGETVIMDVAPTIIDGRTFVPLRYAANGCGISNENIAWFPPSIAQLYKDDLILNFEVGYKTINIWRGYEEDAIDMDVAPVIINGRMMLPVRYVAESLGKSVYWDAQTRTVTIR